MEGDVGGHVACIVEQETQRKTTSETGHTWELNIKRHLREMCCGGVVWASFFGYCDECSASLTGSFTKEGSVPWS